MAAKNREEGTASEPTVGSPFYDGAQATAAAAVAVHSLVLLLLLLRSCIRWKLLARGSKHEEEGEEGEGEEEERKFRPPCVCGGR